MATSNETNTVVVPHIAGSEDAWAWLDDPWTESKTGEFTTPASVSKFQSEEAVAVYRQTAFTDFTLTVDYSLEQAGVSNPGVVFRVCDPRRFYWVAIVGGESRPQPKGVQDIVLYRSEPSGLRTELAARIRMGTLEYDKWYQLKVECIDDRIRIYVNDNLALSYRDSAYRQGHVGISGQGPVLFKNLRVEGKPAEPSWPQVPESEATTRVGKRIWTDLSAGKFMGWIGGSGVLLENGHILVGFTLDEHCFAGKERFAYLRSKDSGKTWEPPVIFPREQRHLTQLGLFPDGRVTRHGPTAQGRWEMTFSSDNGESWSEPRDMGIPSPGWPYEGAAVYPFGSLRILHDGVLLINGYLHFESKGDDAEIAAPNQTIVTRSTDAGQTWGPVTPVDSTNPLTNEADVAEVEPGKLICIMRSNNTTQAWRSWSRDGGLTWSPCEPLPFTTNATNLLVTSSGTLVLAHRSRGTAVHYSLDQGMTWSRGTQIDRATGAYPAMMELPDGRIFVAYYEGHQTPSYIRGQFLRVSSAGVEAAGV